MRTIRQLGATSVALVAAMLAFGTVNVPGSLAADAHTTTKFQGVKANSGTATHARQAGKDQLAWSADFKIPDTPAPHWQVVDSKGNVFLLQRLQIKGDKQNRTITLPSYIDDVATVQIWCAWAEVLLGEASFAKPIMTAAGEQRMQHARAMDNMRLADVHHEAVEDEQDPNIG